MEALLSLLLFVGVVALGVVAVVVAILTPSVPWHWSNWALGAIFVGFMLASLPFDPDSDRWVWLTGTGFAAQFLNLLDLGVRRIRARTARGR